MSYALQLIDSLPNPFQGKPVIASILLAYAEQFDHLSRTQAEIDFYRDVQNADLFRLTQIAELVGENSRPTNLETFRSAVLGRIFVNSSDGSIEHVKILHRLLYPSAHPTTIAQQLPPKHLRIYQDLALSGYSALVNPSVFFEAAKINVNMIRDCCDPGTSVTIIFTNGSISSLSQSYKFPEVPNAYQSPTAFLTGAFPLGFNSNDDR